MPRNRFPFFGLVLILLGAILLLSRTHVFHLSFWLLFWPLIMVVGLAGVWRGFSEGRKGKIFWGTVWFLAAMMFFIRNTEMFDMHPRFVVPGFFCILGIGFLMTYLNNLRDWFYLIPAVIFGGLGSLLILADYEYISYWDISDALRMYWPVAIILFGIGVLLRRNGKNAQPPAA